MKQSISPAVIGTVIVVAVLLLGFFGYRAFGRKRDAEPTQSSSALSAEYGKRYQNYNPSSAGK